MAWGDRRVLVPVTEGRRDLAERLAARGVRVDEAECIVIAPTSEPEALEAAVDRWLDGEYRWLAVTSRNAVLAMHRIAVARGRSLDVDVSQVAAVGAATTRVCTDLGLTVSLTPSQPDARGLVAAFPPGIGRVLVPQGNLAAPVLARGLSSLGWEVDAVEAYHTVDGPGVSAETVEAIARGEVDAIVLTSSSVAERIAADLAGRTVPPTTAIVAIGATTAAGARAAGLVPTATAPVPSHDGILETLASIFEETS